MENQITNDGLKWFGEGFDGFPKRLPDDCVEYIIYAIDDRLTNAATTRSRLSEVLKAANDLKKKHLKDHIWQRDGFDLFLHPKIDLSRPREATQGPPHLQGRTNFGDSIADEWLIVYLLTELSRQFPDLWIRVHDGDGEFLLVEAANALPKWLNPDIADNRVWINEGRIKIIPLDANIGSRNLSIDSALSYVRDQRSDLLIDASIQNEAFRRIRGYPSAIVSSLHNAVVTIPRNLAYVLHESPSLTSPAAEAFYLRDPISLKPLVTKAVTNLTFPPKDFVNVSVKFTKVSYAQLRSQIFDAPPAWTDLIPQLREERGSVGMKLTCGFEMLVSDPQAQSNRSVREIQLLLSDLDSSPDALPSNAEIATWPQIQDSEEWLDIDIHDFEAELSSTSHPPDAGAAAPGPGPTASTRHPDDGPLDTKDSESTAHRNLHDLVSRFKTFMDGDEDAAFFSDDDDDDNDAASSTSTASSQHSASTVSSNDFRRAMDFTQTQTPSALETSGLLAEARRLALEDEGEGASGDPDEVTEEEVREIMKRMDRELRGHGALGDGAAGASEREVAGIGGVEKGRGKGKGKARARTRDETGAPEEEKRIIAKPFFGPERPPHLLPPASALSKRGKDEGGGEDDEGEDEDEDFELGDVELSSDEEDAQGVNDVDLTFARNMLEAFKSQAGMSGPAGNLMRALGVGALPRDEGE